MTTLARSLTDLTEAANLPEASARLKRCLTDAEYAAWARTYGEGAIEALEDYHAASQWGGD